MHVHGIIEAIEIASHLEEPIKNGPSPLDEPLTEMSGIERPLVIDQGLPGVERRCHLRTGTETKCQEEKLERVLHPRRGTEPEETTRMEETRSQKGREYLKPQNVRMIGHLERVLCISRSLDLPRPNFSVFSAPDY